MTREAVIVAGARTAIGTAYKGSLVDVDALELGDQAVAEAVRRSGHRARAGRRRRAGRVALRRRGHRPLRRDRGRPGERAGRRAQPALRLRPGGAADARPRRSSPAWTGSSSPAACSPARPRRRRAGGCPGPTTWDEDWLAPSHRETPDAPIRDMTITVGWNAAVRAGISREEHGRLGVALAPAGHRRDRRRQLRRRDLPARGHPPRRHARSPSTSTSTPGAPRPWRSSRR